MLTLPPSTRIYVATERVDGRKGIDGLAALVRAHLLHDPRSGHLFVFFSRRADRARVLYWDRSGFVLITKRLERGTFRPVFVEGVGAHVCLESADLMLLLEGIDLASARRRPRWVPRVAP